MLNKKGFSLLSTLITLVIIAILATIVLKKYQTINAMERTRLQQALHPTQTRQPSGQRNQQNTLQQIRSSVKEIEDAAAKRADLPDNL